MRRQESRGRPISTVPGGFSNPPPSTDGLVSDQPTTPHCLNVYSKILFKQLRLNFQLVRQPQDICQAHNGRFGTTSPIPDANPASFSPYELPRIVHRRQLLPGCTLNHFIPSISRPRIKYLFLQELPNPSVIGKIRIVRIG